MARVCRIGDFIEEGSRVAGCNALHLKIKWLEAHGENGFKVERVISENCRTIQMNGTCSRGLILERGGICQRGSCVKINTCPARVSVSDLREGETSTVLVVVPENCRSVRAEIPALCPRGLGPNQR